MSQFGPGPGRAPSARLLNSAVSLLFFTWTKDAAGGRVVSSTVVVPNIMCQWDPGLAATAVDETGAWATEQPHTFRFLRDPGLKPHDVIRVSDGFRSHDCVVTGPTNPAGRGAYFEVPALERF